MSIETVRHVPCPGCGHTEAQEEDHQTGRHRCLRCGLRFIIDELDNVSASLPMPDTSYE